jgi:hypothetical protein
MDHLETRPLLQNEAMVQPSGLLFQTIDPNTQSFPAGTMLVNAMGDPRP